MNFEQAVAHYERGDLEAAWQSCRAACDAARPEPRLLHLMGLITFRQNKIAEAESLLRQAVALAPDDALFHNNLALPLLAKGDARGAIEALDKALALRPGFPPALEQKAAILMQRNRAQEARPLLETLAEKDRAPGPILSLALCLRALGELEEARARLLALLAEYPDFSQAWWLLTTMGRASPASNHVKGIEAALARADRDEERVPLLFALARQLEDLADFDAAFAAYKRANDLRRAGIRYEIEGDVELFGRIKARDRGGASAPGAAAVTSACPIFIVSMPRTGSTLVERILGSHSQVCAAGELQLIENLVRSASARCGSAYPDSIASMDEAVLQEIRNGYLQRSSQWRDDSPFFTDKMPVNFMYLGLIARIFPDAALVHVQRDPVDTCLSCYRQLFGDYYPFSYDLAELGQWYGLYRDLMAHWEQVLPGRILNLEYEALVADPEGEARRLIGHCGLEWEPACLEFMTGGGAVLTPSAGQVRESVHGNAVGRWRRYRSHLDPLLHALGSHFEA